MSVRRMVAAGLAVAAVLLLAGPGWALLAAAGLSYVAWPGEPGLAGAWVRVRTLAASWAAWATAQKLSMLLVPAAVVATAVGLALALGPGWGVAAAGIAMGALGLQLERAPGT